MTGMAGISRAGRVSRVGWTAVCVGNGCCLRRSNASVISWRWSRVRFLSELIVIMRLVQYGSECGVHLCSS
jgi:hypothetical protein